MYSSIAPRRGRCCRVFVFIALIPALAFAEPGERKFFGKGNPFTADELPAGKLKEQIQALDPQARGKAMKWLHSFQFSASDAATHLRVDRQGGVFYTCPGDHKGCKDCKNGTHQQSIASPHDSAVAQPLEGSSEATVEEAGETAGGETAPPEIGNGPVPVSSPPVYNSKPGAPYHIYLDFNGAYVTGKAWAVGSNSTWDCYAWSTDSDYTTFSDTEQANIRRMWERVAEDYAPFDVNVTTDVTYDPDTYTGDKNKVGWLLITQTTDKNGNACPHSGAGGVAYVGVFGRSDYFSRYQPAWTTPMGQANTAEAASHEMGHNMGLSHDTTNANSNGYYGGHGSGDTSWGPIMGTGYNRNVSQWTKGEYYDYYNTQSNDDDLAVITTKVPYRTDDHGDTIGAASLITPLADGSLDQVGVIETTSDPDVFQFSTGAGSITINANPYKCDSGTFGGNLDIILELYDGGGGFITSSNPTANTYASITAEVSAGNYYIIVKPTGVGNPTASSPTGYTVYGSLGQYTITGNVILPGVSVTESGGTNVTEGGATDTYTLSLGTAPSANVVVDISPDSQLSVDKTEVTFTPSNWSTPQTVTVTAADDSVEEGTHTGTITHTSSSSDGAFNGIDVGSVIATITDNDDVVVTSPNGGESYYANTVQTIQWNSLMGGNVKIELLKGGSATTIIGSTPNDGSYAWSIPQFQTAAADYRIRITSVETPTRSDVSDGFFTIIEAPIYFSDLETNPSYTVSGTGWVRGAPTLYSALSGTQVFATNLTGTSWATSSLTSAAIDCSNYTNVQLEYFMWALLRNDTGTYPGSFTGKVEVSNTGTDWGNTAGKSKIVFQQTGMNTNWVQYNYDISDIADNQSTVYIRWSQINNNTGSYQTTNGGMGLEDIKLTGTYSSPVTTYTVTYNGNGSDGGSVPVDTAQYEEGATVTVLGNTNNLSRSGFVFAGWNTQADGNGTPYSADDAFTIGAADVNLYAVWTQAYSVTYNGNGSDGGSVPVDGNNYLPGANVTVLGNSGNLVRTGYIFSGWQTSPSGGTQYSADDVFAIGSADVTLYARWTAAATYDVVFMGNGNTGGAAPANQTKTEGVDLVLSGPGTLVKTGNDFVGWNTAANGSGTSYAAGASYTTDADLTLYAQWEVSTYSITYSGNGQTGGSAPANQTKIYDENITISDAGTLVRFGYTFDSWNTEPNGSGDTYAEGAVYSVNANLDLFAQWTPNTYTVTYVGNGNTGGSVPANQTKTHDVGLTLATAGSLVRTNTSFSGWNTAADGSGEAYAGGATYSGNTDITLYAQWSQSIVVLTEDFESPASITGYVELQLPDNGNWVAANDGSNGTKEHQHGMTDKAGGDFVAADPNHQAYSFRGANSGITTVAGAIGTLSEGSTYSVDFDLIPMDGSGNKIFTDYRVQLIAFASGAARNDCSAIPSGSLLLKEVSGTLDGPVSLSYTTGEVSDSSYMGYDIGLRFIGSGSSGVIDNISVEVGSLAPPGDPFDNWTGGGGGSGFSGDGNGDGVPDGLAWAMGANGPSSNAHGLMPVVDNESEAGFMIFNYRRLDAANEDSKTNFAVEYGTTLGSWTTATHDGTNTIIQFQDNYYGDGVDRVQVKLKRSAHGSGGKLFSRLKVTRTP